MVPTIRRDEPQRNPRTAERQPEGLPGQEQDPDQAREQTTLPALFLLSNQVSAHSVRTLLRRAGLDITVEQVKAADVLEDRLHADAPRLIVADAKGPQGLLLPSLTERAMRHHVPIIALGASGETPPGAGQLGACVCAWLTPNQLDRLPSLVESTLVRPPEALELARLQRELEQATEALRENQKMVTIGRLAASIAHEINNPLESITNLLYLMACETDLSDNLRSYLNLAQRELNRVVQISKQTLNFYRETSAPVRVKPADLIEETLVLYSRKIEMKRLNVVRSFRTDRPVTVFPGEMRQVLSNLITNAIEASSTGGTLQLRVENARNWGDHEVLGVRIVVADNGSGIEKSARARLGQPFFTTKGQRGTGLGLWVTQSIIHRYGGHLDVRSTTERNRHGTVFSVFLPTNLRPQAVQNRQGFGAHLGGYRDAG